MNDDRLTELEKQIDALTDAHRALSAEHMGLMAVCRVMLPLIPARPAMRRRLLTSAYDTYSAHMQSAGQDAEYQRMVRDAIDMVSASVMAAEDNAAPHANKHPGASELRPRYRAYQAASFATGWS